LGCLSENTILDCASQRLGPEETARVREHVEDCESCRQLLAEVLAESETRTEALPEFERYRITRQLGAGGMGVVYEAFDSHLKRKVAIKLLHLKVADSVELRSRLLREAQTMAQLSHPNVIGVFDVGTFGDQVFLAMELATGGTLDAWLRQPRTQAERLARFFEAGAGLMAAHRAGIVHRDFKPANVLLDESGRARVTDFGLARMNESGAASESGDPSITRSGSLMGTPAYMAPEQFASAPVSPRTDQFSFCVALYEALYGERPFAGANTSELAEAVTTGRVRPAPPSSKVSRRLRRVLLSGLSADPEARFPSMDALLDAVRGASRRPTRWVAAAALPLLIAAGAVAYQVLHLPPRLSSVAVLAPRNASGQAEAAWMATALGELLTAEMAGPLRVPPSVEVARAKKEVGDDPRAVAKALGCEAALTGSYVALNGQVRLEITVDEIGGRRLVSLSETGAEGDLLGMTGQLANRVRAVLGSPSVENTVARAALPANVSAARFYAEGLAHQRDREHHAAKTALERALSLDPASPIIHAALARTWKALGYDLQAKKHARLAFDRADTLPEEDRLFVEATFHALHSDFTRAAAVYRGLWQRHPDRLDVALVLANALDHAGKYDEALGVLDQSKSVDPRVDVARAHVAFSRGDAKQLEKAAQAAVERATQAGQRLVLAEALELYAVGLGDLGKIDEAKQLLAKAEAGFREAGDRGRVLEVKNQLAILQYNAGDLAGAGTSFRAALEYAREVGDAMREATSLNNIANVLADQGDLRGARTHYAQAVEVSRKIDDRIGVIMALHNLGANEAELGELVPARLHLDEALKMANETGEKRSAAGTLNDLGLIAMKENDLGESRRLREAALALYREVGDVSNASMCLFNLGQVSADLGEWETAKKQLEEAMAMRVQLGQEVRASRVRLALAQLALEERRPGDAEKLAEKAVSDFSAARSAELRESHLMLALAQARLGKREAASASLAAAEKLPADQDPERELRLQRMMEIIRAQPNRLRALLSRAHQKGWKAEELELRLALAELDGGNYASILRDAERWKLLGHARRAKEAMSGVAR
jgi:tetratricopeptide (TPR) repeat protein